MYFHLLAILLNIQLHNNCINRLVLCKFKAETKIYLHVQNLGFANAIND